MTAPKKSPARCVEVKDIDLVDIIQQRMKEMLDDFDRKASATIAAFTSKEGRK